MKFTEVKPGMVLHNLGYQIHYLFVREVNKKYIGGDRIFYSGSQMSLYKDIKIYREGWKDWNLSKAMIESKPNFHSVIYAIFRET